MEENKGSTKTTTMGVGASKPPRPTLSLPPRNTTEAFLKGADAATPSPMTFVASLFADHDPYEGGDAKSFSQLLAGAIASSSSLPSSSSSVLFDSKGDSATAIAPAREQAIANVKSSAKFKSKMPPKLPIPKSPYITIPPGLSPTMLLQSPVLLPSIKAEPSPTTGTFILAPFVQESGVASKGSQDGSFTFKSLPGLPESPLANMGPFGVSHQEALAHVQAQALSRSLQEDPTTQVKSSALEAVDVMPSSLVPSTTSSPDLEMAPESMMELSENLVSSQIVARANPLPAMVERPSEDGYNWRKYGQKQVKGSEYPRSYYKCTHSSCPVRKKVERSYDGQITEIIYKGDHNHPKPPATRRTGLNNGLSSDSNGREDLHADRTANYRSSADPVARLQSGNLSGGAEPSLGSVSDDDAEGAGEDEFDSKRRRLDNPMANPPLRTVREPRVVVQTTSEVDILIDGYNWRKYGQKVVKGNPHPRSYYRCTSAGCMVRKHVERSSVDSRAVITTYEGKHNHDVPAARNSNYEGSGRSVKAATGSTSSGGNPNVSKSGAISLQDQLFGKLVDQSQTISKMEMVAMPPQPLSMAPNMSRMMQSDDEYFGEVLAFRPKEEPIESHSVAEPRQ